MRSLSRSASLTSFLIEIASVIFAVILALVAKDYHETIQKRNEALRAISSIEAELTTNKENLLQSIESQELFLDTLEIYYDHKFDFSHVKLGFADMFNKAEFNFGMTPISTISWETAQYTGIVKEFDFELLSRLAEMDFTLEALNGVINELRKTLYNKNIFDPHETRKVFLTVMFLLEDLIKQEKKLANSYDAVLTEIEKIQ